MPAYPPVRHCHHKVEATAVSYPVYQPLVQPTVAYSAGGALRGKPTSRTGLSPRWPTEPQISYAVPQVAYRPSRQVSALSGCNLCDGRLWRPGCDGAGARGSAGRGPSQSVRSRRADPEPDQSDYSLARARGIRTTGEVRLRRPCLFLDACRLARRRFSQIIDLEVFAMNTLKQAKPDHPVHELIADRWSPYGFADRPVSPEDLRSLFEAARWAPSSYNEQPWSYLVATKANPEQFAAIALLSGGGESGLGEACPGAGLGLHEPAVHPQQPAQRGRNPRLGSCRGRHLRGGHRSRACLYTR